MDVLELPCPSWTVIITVLSLTRRAVIWILRTSFPFDSHSLLVYMAGMMIPRCLAIATLNGRCIAVAYSGFEDLPIPPESVVWVAGARTQKAKDGLLRQAETNPKEGKEAV
jgi:hypothetical protein